MKRLSPTSSSIFFSLAPLIFIVGLWAIRSFLPVPVFSQLSSIMNRVSVDSDGTQGNNSSTRNSIDSGGNHIAFTSLANNLVESDTNLVADVFVYIASSGEVHRVSVSSASVQGNGESDSPSISSDGRYVAFQSAATNLIADDTNGFVDIFVHDRETDTTERVSIHTDETEANGPSLYPSISADGRYVAFQSAATNLVDSDTNNVIDIFVHDRTANTTEIVSINSDGVTESNGHSIYPSISGDGRYVAFSSVGTNLVSGDTNSVSDVFVHDRTADTTIRISVATDSTEADGLSTVPSVNEDGRYIAYESEATNLVSNDTNGVRDVFLRDTHLNVTSRISVGTGGVEGNGISGDTVDNPNGRLSANGQYIAFKSRATNLVEGDTNGIVDVFVHDLQTGVTTRVNTDQFGAQANGASYYPSISKDGRYVGFYSYANNLVSGDTNGVGDVFVYDRDGLEPTITPTLTPTAGPTPGVTVTPTPPLSTVTVTMTQNIDSPTVVSAQTSAGTVKLRCERVHAGGDIKIQVLDTPPGQLTDQLKILPTNFDITSDTVSCDVITVCLPYKTAEVNNMGLDEAKLRLWHHRSGPWDDVTTLLNMLDREICGKVSSFSPFVIGVSNVQAAADDEPHDQVKVVRQVDELPKAGATGSSSMITLLSGLLVSVGSYLIAKPFKFFT